MNVALLTYHDTLNHGAALQVYATQKAIENLGAECTVIDYANDHRKKRYDMSYRARAAAGEGHFYAALRYSARSILTKPKHDRFAAFYRKYLHLTDEHYSSSEEADALNDRFDKFIVGSDQVWNPINNGRDFAYCLDFVRDDGKKIAYASSFGLSQIPEPLTKLYAENLNRINYLSTREERGLNLIKDLTGRDSELVLDPVFLLNKEQWLTLSPPYRRKSRYVFCYTNGFHQWPDFASRTGYPARGIRVHKLLGIRMRDFLDPGVKITYWLSPVQFIAAIACAELVFTTSFHCTAMAIILNSPFIAVLSGDEGRDERLRTILRIAGLENRILSPNTTLSDVREPIDFARADARIDEYRKRSLEFLGAALADR